MPNRLLSGTAVIGVILAAAACASTPDTRTASSCALAAADSAYIGSYPLYPECAVDEPAKSLVTRMVTPNTSELPPPRPGTTCYSAEVQFVVGIDGRPEPATVRLVNTTSDAFSRAVLASVSGWLYTPAVLDGQPVRQLVRESRSIALRVSAVPSRGARPPRSALPPRCL